VLYFVSRDLALGYLLFSFLSALGILQWVSMRAHLVGLELFDYSKCRGLGVVLTLLLPVSGLVWFMATQWGGIFAPGPAGSEISLLFGAAAVAAVLVSLVGASLRRAMSSIEQPPGSGNGLEVVALGHLDGKLCLPPEREGALPVVCLLPSPGMSSVQGSRLSRRLNQDGFAVLVVAPDHAPFTYPDIVALMPAAISFLRQRSDLDAQRVGVLGFDLGGDLAIRAGGSDKEIKATVALAPLVLDSAIGMDLLAEMSYWEAWRWAHDRRRTTLRAELDALHFAARIAPRPLLLIYGSEDRLVVRAPAADWDARQKGSVSVQIVEGSRHLDLLDDPACIRSIVEWLRGHL
jgi:pimeloyl-ACP methyl ester carboxylesterase